MISPLLDIAETARKLKIARKTLYKYIEKRYIPYVRIGRLVRFRERDLEEWVEARLQKSVAERDTVRAPR